MAVTNLLDILAEKRLIESFTRDFADFCSAYALFSLTAGVDRHGSFVWEAGTTDILNRYLTLSATPVLVPEPGYLCEISIGADDNTRYLSIEVREWFISEAEVVGRRSIGWLDGKLQSMLSEAWSRAKRIVPAALTSRYIAPRHPPHWYEGHPAAR